MGKSYWLLKTEPGTYSFEQLLQDGKTNWNGVRNFQARNYLRQVKMGEQALIYHSGDTRAVIGIATILGEAYPDPDPKKPGDWVQVNLEPLHSLTHPVPLTLLKSVPSLKNLLLIKQSRLSVMPVVKEDFETILQLSKKDENP